MTMSSSKAPIRIRQLSHILNEALQKIEDDTEQNYKRYLHSVESMIDKTGGILPTCNLNRLFATLLSCYGKSRKQRSRAILETLKRVRKLSMSVRTNKFVENPKERAERGCVWFPLHPNLAQHDDECAPSTVYDPFTSRFANGKRVVVGAEEWAGSTPRDASWNRFKQILEHIASKGTDEDAVGGRFGLTYIAESIADDVEDCRRNSPVVVGASPGETKRWSDKTYLIHLLKSNASSPVSAVERSRLSTLVELLLRGLVDCPKSMAADWMSLVNSVVKVEPLSVDVFPLYFESTLRVEQQQIFLNHLTEVRPRIALVERILDKTCRCLATQFGGKRGEKLVKSYMTVTNLGENLGNKESLYEWEQKLKDQQSIRSARIDSYLGLLLQFAVDLKSILLISDIPQTSVSQLRNNMSKYAKGPLSVRAETTLFVFEELASTPHPSHAIVIG